MSERELLKYKDNYTEDTLDVAVHINVYVDKNNIYLGLSYIDDEGYLEPYGDITVNLSYDLMPYYAYLDTNNLSGIDGFIEENGIGSFTGITKMSGFCEYPLYELKPERLAELDPEGVKRYEDTLKYFGTGLKERRIDEHIEEIRREAEKDFQVVLVRPGLCPEAITIDGSLESMQRLVGGYIEAVGGVLTEDDIIIVNEEGKLNGSFPNRGIYDKSGNLIDIIYGDFFICSFDGENFTGLSDEKVDGYCERFKCPEIFYYSDEGTVHGERMPDAVREGPAR